MNGLGASDECCLDEPTGSPVGVCVPVLRRAICLSEQVVIEQTPLIISNGKLYFFVI